MIPLNQQAYSRNFINFLMFSAPFQAGYVNVGAFHIADGFFVSHVTGTSSMIGMGIGSLDIKMFITFLTVLVSFILGASFSGYFIKYYSECGKLPLYSRVMFVKFIFFGVILLLSEFDLFYTNAEVLNISHLLMLFLLSFCCGVQNSASSLITNGFLKPTHMTGLSTDIGIHLYQIFSRTNDQDYKNLIKRIVILICFISGGTLAQLIFSIQGYYGFLFPFLSAFIFWINSEERLKNLRFNQDIFKITFSILIFSTLALGVANFTQAYWNK